MKDVLAKARLLSMTEMARRLDLPESTVRYYCKRFLAYLPSSGKGRLKRFYPEAMPILEFIVAAIKENKNALAVELMLKAKLEADKLGSIPSATGSNCKEQLTVEEYLQAQPIIPRLEQQAKAELAAQAPLLVRPAFNQNSTGFAVQEQAINAAGQEIIHIMERQAQALESITKMLNQLGTHMEQNLAFMSASVSLQAGCSNTVTQENSGAEPATDINILKQQMNTAERVHQEDLEQLRKWLHHLGEAVAKLK